MSFIINNLIQGSDEWHSFRRKGIGASDAPALLGCSPWKNQKDVFEEKMGLSTYFENDAMRRGKELEPYARDKISEILGISLSTPTIVSSENKWQFASLDGFNEDKKIAIEIKCSGNSVHNQYMEGVIPDYVYAQIQHQLCILKYPFLYLFAYNSESFNLIQVASDEAYIKKLLAVENEFYRRMAVFDPPEEIFLEKDDDEWKHYSDIIKTYELMNKNNQLIIDDAKAKLIELSQGKNCKGNGIALRKVCRQGHIDYNAIPEIHQIDLEKYRKPASSYWRFSSA